MPLGVCAPSRVQIPLPPRRAGCHPARRSFRENSIESWVVGLWPDPPTCVLQPMTPRRPRPAWRGRIVWPSARHSKCRRGLTPPRGFESHPLRPIRIGGTPSEGSRMRYVTGTILGGLFTWILFVIARLGGPWVAVGAVGFAGLIIVSNRLARKPEQKVGQPPPEHRVISTDQDRWGGGSIWA